MNDSIFQHKNGTGKEISAWSIFSLILKKFHWLLLSGAAIALAVFLPFPFLLHRHINQPQLSMYITVQTGYQPREKSIITTFRLPRALLLHIQKYSRVMRFSIRFCRIWTTRTSYQEKSFPNLCDNKLQPFRRKKSHSGECRHQLCDARQKNASYRRRYEKADSAQTLEDQSYDRTLWLPCQNTGSLHIRCWRDSFFHRLHRHNSAKSFRIAFLGRHEKFRWRMFEALWVYYYRYAADQYGRRRSDRFNICWRRRSYRQIRQHLNRRWVFSQLLQ